MNKTQFKLIELAARKNIWDMPLRAIGNEVGIKNASTVKYYLDQLKKDGLIKKPEVANNLNDLKEQILQSQRNLLNIPILGSANCGIAMLIAEEMFEGYLKISPQLLNTNNYNNLFALTAEGDSMNMANINTQKIEEGDYLIIDGNRTNPSDGKYVLSIIDGCANIKKYKKINDTTVALISESTNNYPPIYIHANDNYLINGEVISVIKKPQIDI